MKTALKISLVLNLGLAGACFFLWSRPAPSPAGFQPVTDVQISTPTVLVSAPSSVPSAAPPAFRWSQLDAEDYHVYVKNLRAIGCPEATVRAIVSADVHGVYDARMKAIEKKLASLDGGSWQDQASAGNNQTALKNELRDLPAQADAMIADLLGLKMAPAPTVTTAFSPRVNPPSLPLIFQNFDAGALNLSESQQQAVASVRQDFLQQIGGTNQDPNDPAYLARWQRAQPAADDALQAMLGNDAYTKYQMAAYQAALENRAKPVK